MRARPYLPPPLRGRVGEGGRAPDALKRARKLRRDATHAERLLWSKLRRHQVDGLQFRRQSPIGRYIVDFVCPAAQLIVEVDGGQHTAERDAARTAWLEGQGFRVLRFWNDEVLKNIDGVLRVIANAATPPLPCPPPQGGREK